MPNYKCRQCRQSVDTPVYTEKFFGIIALEQV